MYPTPLPLAAYRAAIALDEPFRPDAGHDPDDRSADLVREALGLLGDDPAAATVGLRPGAADRVGDAAARRLLRGTGPGLPASTGTQVPGASGRRGGGLHLAALRRLCGGEHHHDRSLDRRAHRHILALRLRDKKRPLPGAIVSISPWGDLEIANETIATNAETDKILSKELLEFFRDAWIDGTFIEFTDTRINLNRADLSGLPPTLVSWGTYEVLAGEDEEFAARVKDAGIDTATVVVPGGQHSYVYGAGRFPETDPAIAQIGAWIREKRKIWPSGAGAAVARSAHVGRIGTVDVRRHGLLWRADP